MPTLLIRFSAPNQSPQNPWLFLLLFCFVFTNHFTFHVPYIFWYHMAACFKDVCSGGKRMCNISVAVMSIKVHYGLGKTRAGFSSLIYYSAYLGFKTY